MLQPKNRTWYLACHVLRVRFFYFIHHYCFQILSHDEMPQENQGIVNVQFYRFTI